MHGHHHQILASIVKGVVSLLRNDRFDPIVPIISENDFSTTNYLQYYNKTPENPTKSSVIYCLKILDNNGDFEGVIKTLEQSVEEDDIIKLYSSDIPIGRKRFYTYINQNLYDDNAYEISNLMPLIRRATHQINYKSPSSACTVFRGMNLQEKHKIFFQVGNIFRFPGFVSTSKSKENAEQFGDTLLIIQVYAGCLQIRDIGSISIYPGEEEYLFSPYSLFQVLSVAGRSITLRAMDNKTMIPMTSSSLQIPKPRRVGKKGRLRGKAAVVSRMCTII